MFGTPEPIQPDRHRHRLRHCGSLFWAAGFAGARHGLDAGFSPADLTAHRFLWAGLALLPLVLRNGVGDLNGIGWGRGIVLAMLGGPGFAIMSYAGFLLVPLGHGGVIQPACATLGGLLLATLLLGERLAADARHRCADHRLRSGGDRRRSRRHDRRQRSRGRPDLRADRTDVCHLRHAAPALAHRRDAGGCGHQRAVARRRARLLGLGRL